VFARIAGSDGEVDAYELQTILNTVFMKGQPLSFDPIFSTVEYDRSPGLMWTKKMMA